MHTDQDTTAMGRLKFPAPPDLMACGIVDRVALPMVEILATQYGRVRAARRVI
jgi:hypothetical protein